MNNRNNRIKKALFLIATYFTVILTANANSDSKNTHFPYNETSTHIIDPYATYSNGAVYISDEDTIRSIIIDSDDIYIVDYRNCKDPNMSICNSYKVTSKEQICEIIDIILEYEKQNPSNWYRTKESLYNEWIIHNTSYQFGILKSRSGNVDLDNRDEIVYKFLKILK